MKSLALVLLSSMLVVAQSPKAREAYDKARKEVAHGHLGRAEKQAKEAIAEAPTWALAHAELGDIYFYMPQPEAAGVAYGHARDIDLKDHSLTQEQRREVYGNLSYVLGTTGEHDKSIVILEAALKEDPNFGTYEYNLACNYSEQGDLDKALAHLKRAWELRDTFKFPDVTRDSSFVRWRNDPNFQRAAKQMGSPTPSP